MARAGHVLQSVSRAAPQPEVLVADARNGIQMVIERKSIYWPPEHAKEHEKEHEFANAIWQRTMGKFQDACYELMVSAEEVRRVPKRALQDVGSEIAAALNQLHSSKLSIRRSSPIHWGFRRVDNWEQEERTGIVVVQQQQRSLEGFLNTREALAGTAEEMEQQLAAAARKFVEYTEMRKLVLLYFYGSVLAEDDIHPLIPSITIPECIDEIWMAKREWVSAEDFEVGFERIFERP